MMMIICLILEPLSVFSCLAIVEAPVFAGLHNCSSASNLLSALSEKASKIGSSQIRCLAPSGLERLEFLESVEKILTLKDNYC